jgi:hypothetical protein
MKHLWEDRSMRSQWIAVVVTVAGLTFACARGAQAQAPIEPCAQLTSAQVSNALGETVGTGQKSGTKTCTWVADKPIHQIVTLMFSPPGDWVSRKTRPMPGVTKSSVSGIGDDAMAETAGDLTTLFVKKGNTTFMVRVYGVPAAAKQLAIETPIAQAVAARL